MPLFLGIIRYAAISNQYIFLACLLEEVMLIWLARFQDMEWIMYTGEWGLWQPVNQYLLSFYHEPSVVLGAGDMTVSKTVPPTF